MRGNASAGFPYVWNPSYPARVGVMPRDGGAADVRWFDVEPCYVFHPLNAYDDGDNVVLDVVRHPKMFATDPLGPNEGDPTLDRWTVDLAAGKVLEERIDDRGQEFPRVDERLVGRRHRYGYAAGFRPRHRRAGVPRAPPTSSPPRRCSSTTWWPGQPRPGPSARAPASASSCSSPPTPTPPRTKASSWASSTTARPTAAR